MFFTLWQALIFKSTTSWCAAKNTEIYIQLIFLPFHVVYAAHLKTPRLLSILKHELKMSLNDFPKVRDEAIQGMKSSAPTPLTTPL
jgi:hypothetical protein